MIEGRQWEIIKILAEGDKSPTEIAKIMKISLPGLHKHLMDLERTGLIKKADATKGKTRPYTTYTIGHGFVYFAKAMKGNAEQGFIEADENVKAHLGIWAISQKEYHYYIESLWWQLQEFIGDIDAIAIFGSVAKGNAGEGSDIDVLLLVKKDVKKFEKLFGTIAVGKKGKKIIIMAQVFETNDFKNSLKKGSKFAEEVIKNHKAIYDPDEILLTQSSA
ncbi:MAG: nucleotidyltransferase domain-containing protein [Nanoarchaeota archaeon]